MSNQLVLAITNRESRMLLRSGVKYAWKESEQSFLRTCGSKRGATVGCACSCSSGTQT